jgi:hypothetical protein
MDDVLRNASALSALAIAVLMLGACGRGTMGTSSAPHEASLSRNVAPASVGRRGADISSADAGRHGPEIESGSIISITDSHVHMAYPATATVERTADGVVVRSNGKTWKFSAAATVSSGGSYHVYGPVNH